MSKNPIIIWFRQDLRRHDHPALYAAYESGHPVLPVYILDDDNAGDYAMGAASRWWLHESLKKLNDSLNGHLHFYKGKADEIIPDLVKKSGAGGVYWNRCYEPWRIARDKKIKEHLQSQDIDVQSFNGSLLMEPWNVSTQSGDPYKVYSPFYKSCRKAGDPPEALPAPERLTYADDLDNRLDLEALDLLPEINWHEKMAAHWTPGEDGAQALFDDFLDDGLNGYAEGRNRPDQKNVSYLSPHIHYGEISPRTLFHSTMAKGQSKSWNKDAEKYVSELYWREFSYNLLYHFPTLPKKNLQEKFDAFPWRDDEDALHKWRKGQTGFPIVDAGMRQLWETGYMHNRVRMIVGSFLVKNLLLHWHHGEAWFWDCLVDADLANNSASWQWIAGCGADAAPYFRIFNPILQGKRFDPEGDYVRQFVPELKDMPKDFIHEPWAAPVHIRQKANVRLGHTYPEPICSHPETRDRALEAYEKIKG